MDDETWGYKVCADNHERDTSVIRKSIKKLCQPSVTDSWHNNVITR